MKVALDLQPCLREKCGISEYTYQIAKALTANNHKMFIANAFLSSNTRIKKTCLAELQCSIQISSLFPYGIYRRIWNVVPIRYKWLFKTKSDIVHFFDFIVPKGVESKVVNTIHDVTWIRFPETMNRKTLRRITQDIQYSINRSDRIVTISESTKGDLVSLLHIPEEKIVIAPPGVDIVAFQRKYSADDVERIREHYHLPEQYILYMGTLEPRKNLERLVQAFALIQQESELQSYKLVLAGKKGWHYDSIFQQIQKYGLEDSVICTGYVEEDDKAAIYQMAELFVFPSLYEGFGMPVAEAMAAGIPVITSNVSSLPEVAGDAAVLIEPENVNQLATAMESLLTDADLRQQCVSRGLEQCRKFTWDRSAEILVQMYHQMMLEK